MAKIMQKSTGKEVDVIPRKLEPIEGVFALKGLRIGQATSKKKNLKLEGIPGHPNVIIPAGLGLNKGEELIGKCSLQKATYFQDEDGETLTPPIERLEMQSYTSLAAEKRYDKLMKDAELENAIADSKIAAVATIKWDAAAFVLQPTADELA